MFQSPPREGLVRSWLLVGAGTVLIYSAIPVARRWLGWLESHGARELVRWGALVIIVLAAALAVFYLYQRLRQLTWPRLFWMTGVVGVFGYFLAVKMKTPGEALHFVEYGLLGLLALRALSHHLRDGLVYVCAFLLCLLVGTVDEILQWLTPGRVWDIRDVLHNGVAAALAQLVVAGGLRPPFIRGFGRPRSVRWFCALSAALLVLLGCCASNTPVAMNWYSSRIPLLGFLRHQDHPMSEYGFRYDIPDIGRFYSRFRLDDLAWMDQQRGEEAGRIIDHYWSSDTYSNFLQRYTPATDPFVHEANVHLYRRTHYWGVSYKHRDTPANYRRHITIAVRENQILERYFPRTLAASGRAWPDEQLQEMWPHVNTNRLYKSEVSRHLITQVSEKQIWHIILLLLLADLVLLIWKGREPARSS